MNLVQRLRRLVEILFPRVEVARLRRELQMLKEERQSLVIASRNASESAMEANTRAIEAGIRESKAMSELTMSLQRLVNFQAFHAGSKIPVFPGIGPDLPETKPIDISELINKSKTRAADVGRSRRESFIKEFAEKQLADELNWEEEIKRQEAQTAS